MLLGMPLFPLDFRFIVHITNSYTIEQLLNTGNVFDFDVAIKNKDLLTIAIQFEDTNDHHHYGFQYQKGKWIEKEYDPFLWLEKHEEILAGKIKNVFNKRSKIHK